MNVLFVIINTQEYKIINQKDLLLHIRIVITLRLGISLMNMILLAEQITFLKHNQLNSLGLIGHENNK